MSRISDLTSAGFTPLQDHRPNIDLALRIVSFAARITGRDTLGRYEVVRGAEDFLGDVLCSMFWARDPKALQARPISGWAHAWPAILRPGRSLVVVESRGGGPGTAPPPTMIPLLLAWSPDPRFEERPVVAPTGGPRMPFGTPGTALAGTDERAQREVFLPAWWGQLVAVHRAGDPLMGSRVFDLTPEHELDLARFSPLQAMMRILRGANRLGSTIAWNIGVSGRGDVEGGYVVDSVAADPRVVVSGPGLGAPIVGGGAGGLVAAAVSRSHGGPFDVGSPGDRHRIGTDADGHPINPLHLAISTLFRSSDAEDGPLFVDGFQDALPLPNRARVHFGFDQATQHWRWWAESPMRFIYSPPWTPWTPWIPWTPWEPPPPEPPPWIETGPGGGSPPPPLIDQIDPPITSLPPPPLTSDGPIITFPPGLGPPPTFSDSSFPTQPPFPGGDSAVIEEPVKPPRKRRRRQRIKYGLPTGEFVDEELGDDGKWRQVTSQSATMDRHRPWQPSDGKRGHLGTDIPISVPSLLVRPIQTGRGGEGAQPDDDLTQAKIDATAPIVAQLTAYGRSTGPGGFAYTQRPCQGKFAGGTASGGLVLLPPEADIRRMVPSSVGLATSASYLVAGPGTRFATGTPDLDTGAITTGCSIRATTVGDLTIARHQTAAGTDALSVPIGGGLGLSADGTTWGTQSVSGITAGRTYTWPDKSGTVAMTSDITSGGGNKGALYGDGSDGSVTIAADTTITRDMYYTTLTVNDGVTLETGGYRVFVRDTLTFVGFTPVIAHSGAAGGAGGAAGAGAASGSLGAGLSGGAGAVGAGASGASGSNSVGGGSGGLGGTGSSGAGGGPGSSGTPAASIGGVGVLRAVPGAQVGRGLDGTLLQGGPGGGGGGGDGAVSGGGGGGGGGVVIVCARSITGTGVIAAGGGAGGSPASGNAGGGGGGAGGAVVVVSDAALPGGVTLVVSGGAGGTGSGTGAAGASGAIGRTYTITP